MATTEITLKSILLGSMETFEGGFDWYDEAMREQLADHLATGLEARNARANGVHGRYYFGSFSLGSWSLDVLEERYDTNSLTDTHMQELSLQMGMEYEFADNEDEFDRALLKAARLAKLPRRDGRLDAPWDDEDDEDDEDD